MRAKVRVVINTALRKTIGEQCRGMKVARWCSRVARRVLLRVEPLTAARRCPSGSQSPRTQSKARVDWTLSRSFTCLHSPPPPLRKETQSRADEFVEFLEDEDTNNTPLPLLSSPPAPTLRPRETGVPAPRILPTVSSGSCVLPCYFTAALHHAPIHSSPTCPAG